MLPYRSKQVLRIEDYRVRPADRPGWVSGTARLPNLGEDVFCAAGEGVVSGLGGKTGDGSRLVHIRLNGTGKQPYLAAASNVLLPPASARAAKRAVPPPPSARAEVWLGGSESARGGAIDGPRREGVHDAR